MTAPDPEGDQPQYGRYANPGGESVFWPLAIALDQGNAAIDFPTPYTVERDANARTARVLFETPVLLEVPESDLEMLTQILQTEGFERFREVSEEQYQTADHFINGALDLFRERSDPALPIRSSLRALKGESPTERIIASKHIPAEQVLDMLEEDPKTYGDDIEQPIIDGLIVEEPLEAELIETTEDYPLIQAQLLLSSEQPFLVEGIVFSALPAPANGSPELAANAAYTTELFFRLLEKQSK